ncbi:MAG: hypothetical protein JJE13_07015 [Thermoleophilia bacterium]|nr:hypothetical protein [Thermoleophilia bacterium]
MPAHLTPLSGPTRDALITGDPRRAFALAQAFTVQPKMSHQSRGLWGYTGETESGLGLTVQSTGTGGPGAIAVIGDLAGLGVVRLVRLGTCIAGRGEHSPGDALLVETVISRDGAGLRLATGGNDAIPDPGLLDRLSGTAPKATISSHDFVSRFDPDGTAPAEGASARDLQTAAMLAFSRRLGLAAAAVLVVAGDETGERLAEADLEQTFIEVGHSVVAGLEKESDLNLD